MNAANFKFARAAFEGRHDRKIKNLGGVAECNPTQVKR